MHVPFLDRIRRPLDPTRAGVSDRSMLARLDAAPAGATLRDLFHHSTDEQWLWALTEGRATHPRLRELLPDLPPDDVQANFTGRSNAEAFGQAIAAETLFLRVARELGLDTERPEFRMIDMGCGWGRITQTFLRDFRPEQIEGIDVMDRAVEICRSTRLPCRVHRVRDVPPTDLPASSADLIVAFSVFSHLSERSHLAWVAEASRLLRPGGVLVVTTRGPSFIRVAEHYRSMGDAMPEFARTTACSFTDAKAWLARYDRGEFCFDAPHMSGESGEAFYGQAIVPAAYAERAWAPHFPTVRFVSEDSHGKFDQSIIAGRKAL
jgi:2-polyprenyl-3-methyl-5-hydroxy-6-metoxy-1,4-benzoquinol methylase